MRLGSLEAPPQNQTFTTACRRQGRQATCVAGNTGSIRPIRWHTDTTNALEHTIARQHLATSSRHCSQNCVGAMPPEFQGRVQASVGAGTASPLAALASDGGRLACAPLLGGAAWLLAHSCSCCSRGSTRLCRSSLRLEGPDVAAVLKGGRCQALRAPQAGPGAQDGAGGGGLGRCLEALWQGVRALWQLLGPGKTVALLQMRTGEGRRAGAEKWSGRRQESACKV